MKYNILALLLLFFFKSQAQQRFPDFLTGLWKVENKETYERWDRLSENVLKGFSYTIKNGQITVSEYLDIFRVKNDIFYSATVIGQNNGEGVGFKLVKSDSVFSFENPKHDFPKKIAYKKLADNEVFVKVSGANDKGFSFKMTKQIAKPLTKDTGISNPNYDVALSQKLGGDEMGMKGYVLVILKTGPSQTTDKTLIQKSFMGHMDNINKMVKDGKLVVSGPLKKNDKSYRGIFILNTMTLDEASKLMESDPAIKEGLLAFELFGWYGSAALPEYLDAADKIWKKKP